MKKHVLLAATLAFAMPLAAAATTMNGLPDKVYTVENIEWANEGYTPRAFWLPHLIPGSDKLWESTSGTMHVEGNTATLKGSAANVKDSQLTFDYHLTFTRRHDTLAGYCQFDGPKLPCSDYPLADPTSWDYFDFAAAGLFEGTGILDGVEWSVTDRAGSAHPPQGGYHANALTYGKLGFSTWIWSTLVDGGDTGYQTASHLYTLGANGTKKKGDINLDLAPVPLPAAGWLLLAGVAGLSAVARRRITQSA